MTNTLPTATGSFGDKPTLTFPADAAPADLQVQILEQGDGAEVQTGQTIIVNYLGQVWNGGVRHYPYPRDAHLAPPRGGRVPRARGPQPPGRQNSPPPR